MRRRVLPVGLVVLGALAAWTMSGGAADGDRDWPAYAGDKASTKYSPLDRIDKDTIKNLRIEYGCGWKVVIAQAVMKGLEVPDALTRSGVQTHGSNTYT